MSNIFSHMLLRNQDHVTGYVSDWYGLVGIRVHAPKGVHPGFPLPFKSSRMTCIDTHFRGGGGSTIHTHMSPERTMLSAELSTLRLSPNYKFVPCAEFF
jgi:hypothetical protein